MPRITRATLRSNAAVKNADLAASVPSPSTLSQQRAPLEEIAGNVGEDLRKANSSSQMTKARKNGPMKEKKGNAARKAQPGLLELSENCEEILEDDIQSATSPAVEDACDDLKTHGSSGTFCTWLQTPSLYLYYFLR